MINHFDVSGISRNLEVPDVVADNADDKENIVVTVYEPDCDEWEPDLKGEKSHEVCCL